MTNLAEEIADVKIKTEEIGENNKNYPVISNSSDLSKALQNDCDFTMLRDILKERTIPKELRPQTWQILLGVAHKNDPFAEFDDLFDLSEQDTIRETCSKIFDKLGNEESDRLAITSDLESVVTLYCKTREMRFGPDNGWPDVLQLLSTLKFPKSALYNVFHAVVTKYIPLGCVPNGRPFDLFRLLLLYHDPALCSVLDTRQITPDLYAKHWFNSLFATTCDLEVSLRMWDVYLQQADPFLIFFMALVILINARDQILENKDKPKEETAKFIYSLLYSLGAEDIEDFCQLALHYSARTPQSFRRDYHGPLYGSNLTQAFESITVHSLLCLPVSVQELLRTNYNSVKEAHIHYFVVDGRPTAQYHNGHLPGAFNVDASMIVNDPKKFYELVQRLEELKERSLPESHWCFMGSGREEEDQFVYMVVSYFLQKGATYVSIARGGFKALHEALKEHLSTRLKSHNVKGCIACKEMSEFANLSGHHHHQAIEEMTISSDPHHNNRPKETGALAAALSKKSLSLFNKMKDVVKTKSEEVKTIVTDYVQNTNNSNDANHSSVKHVDATDRHGKKAYRNTASVFTISEEGSSDELSGEELPASDADIVAREKVKIKTWLNKPDIVAHFECQEIDDNRKAFESHLILTKTHLFVLRDCVGAGGDKSDKGFAYIKSRRQLSSVLKITSKRNYPELLTFKYGFELTPGEEKVTASERFYVPKAGDCAKAVKLAILQLIQQK